MLPFIQYLIFSAVSLLCLVGMALYYNNRGKIKIDDNKVYFTKIKMENLGWNLATLSISQVDSILIEF